MPRAYSRRPPHQGYNLGEHRLTSEKMNMYEHTLRIPLVVMGPDIAAGAQLAHLGSNVDLAPTRLALAGIPTPGRLEVWVSL